MNCVTIATQQPEYTVSDLIWSGLDLLVWTKMITAGSTGCLWLCCVYQCKKLWLFPDYLSCLHPERESCLRNKFIFSKCCSVHFLLQILKNQGTQCERKLVLVSAVNQASLCLHKKWKCNTTPQPWMMFFSPYSGGNVSLRQRLLFLLSQQHFTLCIC